MYTRWIIFKSILVIAAVFMTAPQDVFAQGYSGLVSGGGSSSDRDTSSQPSSRIYGYGGLTTPRAAPAPRTPQQPEVTDRQRRQNTYYGQTPVDNPKNNTAANTGRDTPNMSYAHNLPIQATLDVNDGESLKLVAMANRFSKNRRGPVNVKPLNPETLKAINAPAKKVNGRLPGEAQAISVTNTIMDSIQRAAPNARKQAREKAARQIEAMIDVNQARLAAPDDVALSLGITQAAIEDKKMNARASIAHYEKALKAIR